jgi:hypothetical protein
MLSRDRVGRPRACDTDEHSTSDAGGRGPRGGVWSAPKGSSAVAEKACADAVLVPVSALPGRIWAPGRGLKPGGVRPVIGGAAVLAGGVFLRGG